MPRETNLCWAPAIKGGEYASGPQVCPRLFGHRLQGNRPEGSRETGQAGGSQV